MEVQYKYLISGFEEKYNSKCVIQSLARNHVGLALKVRDIMEMPDVKRVFIVKFPVKHS